MDVQIALGADIAMAFDECTEYPADRRRAEESLRLTMAWARRSLDHFRAHGRRERLLRTIEHQPMPEEDPAGQAEDHIQYRALLLQVAQLPERQRDAISLRHSGLSFHEVGRLMGCSEDAAKMLYHRALRALRELVQKEKA